MHKITIIFLERGAYKVSLHVQRSFLWFKYWDLLDYDIVDELIAFGMAEIWMDIYPDSIIIDKT